MVTGPLLEWLRVDDPVGVIPVHLVASLWSLVSVGLFAEPQLLNLEAQPEVILTLLAARSPQTSEIRIDRIRIGSKHPSRDSKRSS